MDYINIIEYLVYVIERSLIAKRDWAYSQDHFFV